MYGICSTSIKTSTRMDANVIRRAIPRRPGVGWRSCRTRCSHEVDSWNEKPSNIQSPHDRHGGCPDTEQSGIWILNTNSHRESRRQVHPIEGPFDVGES